MVEQLKMDVSAVTMKAGEQTGALTASLEQARKTGEVWKRENESVTRELGTLSKKRKFDEYEQDELQAKVQRAKREQDRHADAFNRVQSCVGDSQELVAKCKTKPHDDLVVEFLRN